MRAWEAVEVPVLDDAGSRPPLSLFDTATGGLVPARPDGPARLYVCGITPYDATHLGHAATYVAFDLLHRALLDGGHPVRYVQNVTDVDDPLLERAARDGQSWAELAERETQLFREDMAALRVLPPEHYVGVVESIPLVVDLIARLRERGAVYEVEGDLYFAVHTDPRFGGVSRLGEGEMLRLFGDRGGDPERAGKKHPLDCLLWQAERPGEPAWDSPYGPGRPGWHVECTAIARHHLGAGIDVQGGGSDLAFPHHEMCAAQAQSAYPEDDFARVYAHSGMVGYQGAKMSKSRGNLVFVSRLRAAGVEPAAIRVALLAHHYRDDWEWIDADLVRARERLAAYRAALPEATPSQADQVVTAVREALARDLDAPAALAALDAWARSTGDAPPEGLGAPGTGAGRLRRAVDALLGVPL